MERIDCMLPVIMMYILGDLPSFRALIFVNRAFRYNLTHKALNMIDSTEFIGIVARDEVNIYRTMLANGTIKLYLALTSGWTSRQHKNIVKVMLYYPAPLPTVTAEYIAGIIGRMGRVNIQRRVNTICRRGHTNVLIHLMDQCKASKIEFPTFPSKFNQDILLMLSRRGYAVELEEMSDVYLLSDPELFIPLIDEEAEVGGVEHLGQSYDNAVSFENKNVADYILSLGYQPPVRGTRTIDGIKKPATCPDDVKDVLLSSDTKRMDTIMAKYMPQYSWNGFTVVGNIPEEEVEKWYAIVGYIIMYGSLDFIRMIPPNSMRMGLDSIDRRLLQRYDYGEIDVIEYIVQSHYRLGSVILNRALGDVKLCQILMRLGCGRSLIARLDCKSNPPLEIIDILLNDEMNIRGLMNNVYEHGNVSIMKIITSRNIPIDRHIYTDRDIVIDHKRERILHMIESRS